VSTLTWRKTKQWLKNKNNRLIEKRRAADQLSGVATSWCVNALSVLLVPLSTRQTARRVREDERLIFLIAFGAGEVWGVVQFPDLPGHPHARHLHVYIHSRTRPGPPRSQQTWVRATHASHISFSISSSISSVLFISILFLF
jgi:hypothetical protein